MMSQNHKGLDLTVSDRVDLLILKSFQGSDHLVAEGTGHIGWKHTG